MTDNEISNYLSRIKLEDCEHNFQGLSILQQNHMENIPFENLDVIVGRKIDLDSQSLYHKIVVNKRGGYCFELNMLYANLLKGLGFSLEPVLGRVWLRNPTKTPPRNHLAYLVKMDGETYLTDVGFGGLTTRVPLNIYDSSNINDKDGDVRIITTRINEFMIQRLTEEGWANQYSFEKIPISEEDIDISNYYMSTNPRSHFYKDKFIGKFTENGRIGLFNNLFSRRKGIKLFERRKIEYGTEWIETLREEFHLPLTTFSKEELKRLFEENT